MNAQASSTVRVDLGRRGYEVRVGAGLLGSAGAAIAEALGAPPRRVAVVVDANVPDQRRDELLESLGVTADLIEIDPSERVKTIETFTMILNALAGFRHERTDPVIALGGGIVGDIAGFAAASYRRGVPLVQCPTTLLAMVDASVGGKTGVNLRVVSEGPLLKNMAGAFCQPRLVLADVRTLDSLDDRDFRAGLAECVKHGFISGGAGDPGLLGWIGEHIGPILTRDTGTLIKLVARNVAVKARVVEADELEQNAGEGPSRMWLNLGHTFAHAIEPMEGLSPDGDPAHAPLRHGEAVSVGLAAACALSKDLGLDDGSLVSRAREELSRCGLPVALTGLPPNEELIAAMGDDKKVSGGSLRVVAPTSGCTGKIVTDPPAEALASAWDAVRA